MEKILVVESISTGENFITDIAARNYKPVVLLRNVSEDADPSIISGHKMIRKKYADIAEIYDECETYEKTLALVKKINPILIVTGSESGVELSIHLTEDMGLPGNPSALLPNFVHKDSMQEALRKAGIRSIKGKIIHNVDEALAFYREEDLDGCVIKPIRGAGSVGVRICQNEEELVSHLNDMLNTNNMFGDSMASMLLQEKIDGIEYIVNTVSYNGVHRLSSVWKYNKNIVKGGGKVYDYAITVSHLETGCTRLVKYALDVADAIGYKYGAIHGEYMIDRKGPVLIEVNCRPMGGNMKAGFLDPIEGHHETDNVLDTFLNPEWHYSQVNKPYRNYCTGAFKLIISDKDTSVMSMPILSVIRHLKSYYSASIGGAETGILPRTVDLETAGGSIFLRHDDEAVILRDLEFLRKVEQNYFGIFFDADPIDATKKPENMYTVKEIMDKYNCVGSVLVVSNDDSLDVKASVVAPEKVKNVTTKYNYGILDINYEKGIDIEGTIESFYDLASKIRRGGKIIVPERTYWHIPHSVEGIEVLCESIGLTIEAPTTNDDKVIIITCE